MANPAVNPVATIRVERFKRWVPQLIEAVAEIGGIETQALLAPGRLGWPVMLRAAVILAAVDVMGKGWSEIGRAMRRNHGTMQRAYASAKLRLADDPEFQQLMPRVIAIAHAIAGTGPDRSP